MSTDFFAFQNGAFQLDAFQQYIVETPPLNLTDYEREYALSVLKIIFVTEKAERIYATSLHENISVVDAAGRF